MRHLKATKKLGRKKSARESMIIGQIKTLLKHGKLETTLAKLKVTVAKADSLLSKVVNQKDEKSLEHYLERKLKDKKFAKFILTELKDKLPEKKSGFFRIYKLDFRKGDNAEMALAKLILKDTKKHEDKSNKKK